jgi:hypothetical protein
LLVPAQPLGKREAIEAGHRHVGHDESKAFGARLLKPRSSVSGFGYVQAFASRLTEQTIRIAEVPATIRRPPTWPPRKLAWQRVQCRRRQGR